jgi:superoxide reductase
MAEKMEVYKCEVCGNIVEVLHGGAGKLVCCGQEMKLQAEKTEDVGNEKHVPVVERTEKGVKVKVGAVAHPMEKEHYIEWIQVVAGRKNYRKLLEPGDAPEAEFEVGEGEVVAREYCNIHGLWKGKG